MTRMLELLFVFNNLFLYAAVAISLTLLFSFLKLPTLFLHGLFSYIHPDHVAGSGSQSQSGIRAAIRRPGSDSTADVLQKRHRSKDKFQFDESKAQIFRLKLDSDHLRSRLYYSEYHSACVLFFVTASCLLLYCSLRGGGPSEDSETLVNGSLVPVFLGLFAVSRLFIALGRMSFEKSASRRSEKRLSLFLGGLGFMSGLAICSSIPQPIIDFHFDSMGGFWILLIASLMGCLAGFLYIPATKSARSFWLGTDQICCKLSIISCGWLARMTLYLTFILNVFTALLWIKPLSETLINTKLVSDSPPNYGSSEELVGNVGFSTMDFGKFRLWCLLLSGVSQMVALRPNLQMFLNEAVLSWYQRLHSSKAPDLDFSRAKVFLHNHYLCLALLQFLVPPAMSLVFLGLSQIDDRSLGRFNSLWSNLLLQQVCLVLSWWEVFVWSVYTLTNLVLFRRGFQYVS